jgi:hypothetical protein
MIASGTEIAALGKVLSRAAHTVSTGTSGPLTSAERARAYAEFQAAATDAVVWAEMTLAWQKSLAPSWRPVLAAMSAVAPTGWTAGSDERLRQVVSASRPVARLLLAGQLAEQFDQHKALRSEVANLRGISSRLLAALAQLRLVGGRGPQPAAEQAVMVIGEMISLMPVVEDRIIRQRTQPAEEYASARDAVGYYLREFNQFARMDLSRWPWRRHLREHWWQLYRPKGRKAEAADEDVQALIQRANATALEGQGPKLTVSS